MAWTPEDLAAVQQAIATGAKRVRFANGDETEFRSLAELQQIKSSIEASLGATPTPTVVYGRYVRD